MATVQLTAIRADVAVIQKDADAPAEMTWGLLHEAQQQIGSTGLVYRWLMREYCRASDAARRGMSWTSPRREIVDICNEVARADAAEAFAAAKLESGRLAMEERQRRQEERDAEARRVEAERKATAADDPWYPIPRGSIPDGIRLDTPGRNHGQIVEVAYGTFGRSEAGETGPYMVITDHSDGSVRCYRRREVAATVSV